MPNGVTDRHIVTEPLHGTQPYKCNIHRSRAPIRLTYWTDFMALLACLGKQRRVGVTPGCRYGLRLTAMAARY